MDKQNIEVFLVILRALEKGPLKELAERLKRELETHVDDKRYDFLGEEHQRDLNNLLASYPNLNYTNGVLRNACKSWLHSLSPVTANLGGSNITRILQARKFRGPRPITKTMPTELYSRITLHKKVMGHLSSAYCVCFDQTGQYVFTGADDHLIKIWCARDGRLIKTLRGHDGHICDMSVNYENRLLASAGMDKIIRIWDLKTSKLLECLMSHSATVTSVKFAPYNRHGDDRYLISTSNDGTIVFWQYDVEKFKFIKLRKFKERNRPGGQLTCSSFSTGGSFLACGASDNYIHVYGFHPYNGPYWISELISHTDKVDSVQFCNHGFRFISGSKDGTAIIWTFKEAKWEPMKLDMDMQLDQTIPRRQNNQRPPMVLIVQWSRDDRYVMTSLVDYSIKVWDSHTGRLVHILKEHKHDIYLLESHPIDPRIFVSASHDGSLIIWDIETGKCIKRITNYAEDLRTMSAIYDIKFSPDGTMIAATDSYGYLSLFGNGSSELYKSVPDEMFFNTDYRPVIRDVRNFVMDENTHVAPHLMPRPILVDMNGNPYPSRFQRLVEDHTVGDRFVIPPLNPNQLKCLASVIENHSQKEDEDYLAQKMDPDGTYISESDSDTIVDSDATEITDNYIETFNRAAERIPERDIPDREIPDRGVRRARAVRRVRRDVAFRRERREEAVRRVRRVSARLRHRKRARV